MKKALFISCLISVAILTTISFNTNTSSTGVMTFKGWENPETKFDASQNETMDVKLRWVVVKDIDAACSAENKKRGGGVFKFNVQACSFWEGKECIIMTPKMASIHNLGHEVLHCFRGNFH
jgi:hypothetical protein